MSKSSELESKYNYATLNRKIIAFGIDIVIITLILTPIMNILSMLVFRGENNSFVELEKTIKHSQTISFSTLLEYFLNTTLNIRYILINLVMLILIIAHYILSWAKMGASIGKIIMRCKILDADSYKPITMKQAIKRMIGHVFNFLTFGIGLFMADFTKRKQGLHDKFANTIVVIRKKDT